MSLAGPSSAKGKTYLFVVQSTEDDPDGLPKSWWVPGSLGPVATLLADHNGVRVIRRSAYGAVLSVGVGLAVAVGLMFVVWLPIAFYIPADLGFTYASDLLGLVLAFPAYFAVIVVLYPEIRKLGAWRPRGPIVPITVLEVSLRAFRQELRIEGDGQDAWVRTNARRATMVAALRLAHQIPGDADVSQ